MARKRTAFLIRQLHSIMATTRRSLMRSLGLFALIFVVGTLTAQQPQQPGPSIPAILDNYKPVTTERLKAPEDGEWPMVRRTYDGWGYSPLEQINAKNVTKLVPVWEFSTGVTSGREAPPLVTNGVMFIATPSNQVIAIEAK